MPLKKNLIKLEGLSARLFQHPSSGRDSGARVHLGRGGRCGAVALGVIGVVSSLT